MRHVSLDASKPSVSPVALHQSKRGKSKGLYVAVSRPDGFYRLNGAFSGCFFFHSFLVCNAVFPKKLFIIRVYFFFVTKMENYFLITHGQLEMRAEMSLPDLRTLATHSYSFQASKLIKNQGLFDFPSSKTERKNRQISFTYLFTLFQPFSFAVRCLLSSGCSLSSVLPVTLSLICLTAVMGPVLTAAPNLALQNHACLSRNSHGSK